MIAKDRDAGSGFFIVVQLEEKRFFPLRDRNIVLAR